MGSFILGLLFYSFTIFAETWIANDKHSIELGEHSSCTKFAQGNAVDECNCCLIKSIEIKNLGYAQAVARCNEKHRCSFTSGVEQTRSAHIKARRQLRAVSAIDVSQLTHQTKLPDDGLLLGDHVEGILQGLSQDGYLSLPNHLFEHHDFVIKELSDCSKGVYSGQLFSIQYKVYGEDKQTIRPLYILKETKKGLREIAHLAKVNASPLYNEKVDTSTHFIYKKGQEDLIAHVAFDDIHFKLKTHNKTRYFSLLQTAPGQSIRRHLKDFGALARVTDLDDEDFQVALKRIKHIFYRMGYSMSLLHQKYAFAGQKDVFASKLTFTHGDLHSENIFYDDESDTITLIDNETFALSLKIPLSGVNDIVEFYTLHTIHTLAHRVAKQLTTNEEFGIEDQTWHELCRSLITGYLDAYGELTKEDFEKLYQSFRKEFFDGFSQRKIFKSVKRITDQRALKRITVGKARRKKHLRHYELIQVFDRIHQNYLKKYDHASLL